MLLILMVGGGGSRSYCLSLFMYIIRRYFTVKTRETFSPCIPPARSVVLRALHHALQYIIITARARV